MAVLLKGALVAEALNRQLENKVAILKEKGTIAALAILRVGERSDDVAYERGAMKRCEKVGVKVKRVTLPVRVTQKELVQEIQKLNRDSSVHGILMFRPLPKHMDEAYVCNMLSAEKDVDGITDASMAGVYAGKELGYPPCTPQACMEILDYYGIDTRGKKAVVVGRSLVVGKPAALMLIQKHATVSVCHTRTENMTAVCREADILIIAAGRAKVVDASYLSSGQIVLDVGINVNVEGNLCGDVDFEQAEPIVKAITPVPGGVGTVTTSVLVKHVVEAAERTAYDGGAV